MSTNIDTTEGLDQIIKDSFHQIRTRALRDAPVYLQHVNSAEHGLKQAINVWKDDEIICEYHHLRSQIDELVSTNDDADLDDVLAIIKQNEKSHGWKEGK